MTKKIIQSIFLSITLLFTVNLAVAQQKFVANLSGTQVVPANSSNAKAVCFLTLNETQNGGNLNCDYSNFVGGWTAFSINGSALVGENAPEIYNFVRQGGGSGQNGSFVTGFFGASIALANIRANKIYITLKSANFPNGEIRGQIHIANSAYNDFDGDGRTDLTVYRNSNNTFYSLSSLNQNLTEKQIGQPGDSVSLTVDFDGDGRSDFSTARYNSEVLWRVFKSSTNTLTETRWGSSTLGDFFAAADYEGSGKFDIAVFRAGTWFILDQTNNTFRTEYFGQSGDVPAPNDYDKDGKADLTIARSENGQRVWYSRLSSNNSLRVVQWGLSSDAFFTGRADWDGDGAADISVIRNESGQRVFYIQRSSDNQLQIIRWGLSSDVVKLGDYDGDGKTDAAVTRAINGQRVFFIQQSSNGELRTETFGLQGDF